MDDSSLFSGANVTGAGVGVSALNIENVEFSSSSGSLPINLNDVTVVVNDLGYNSATTGQVTINGNASFTNAGYFLVQNTTDSVDLQMEMTLNNSMGSTLAIQNGATLEAHVVSDGYLEVGTSNSADTVNIIGSLEHQANGIMTLDVLANGQSDLIAIDGDLSLDSFLNVTWSSPLPLWQSYTLLTYTGSINGGGFSNFGSDGDISTPDFFMENGQELRIDYLGGAVTLTIVPEPSALCLLGMLSIAGVVVRCRRRASAACNVGIHSAK